MAKEGRGGGMIRLMYCSGERIEDVEYVTVLFRGASGGGKLFFWCGTISDVLLINFRVLFSMPAQAGRRCPLPRMLQPMNARVAHARTARKTAGMGPLATFSPAGTYGYIIVHAAAAQDTVQLLVCHIHQWLMVMRCVTLIETWGDLLFKFDASVKFG
jgi:hypothetical protein